MNLGCKSFGHKCIISYTGLSRIINFNLPVESNGSKLSGNPRTSFILFPLQLNLPPTYLGPPKSVVNLLSEQSNSPPT